MNWFRRTFRRQRLYSDLSEEIREHLSEKVEELVASGMARRDAESATKWSFGNVTLVEQEGREVWQWPSAENVSKDIHCALRALDKNLAFTIVAVFTLALGIGATTAIYSVTCATLLAPMPYPKPDQLVMVWPHFQHRRVWNASAGDYLDWKRQSTVFEDLNASSSYGPSFNLAAAGHPEQVVAQSVTPGYYAMMGVPFLLGRNFLPEEGIAGKDHVVILTYRLWKQLGCAWCSARERSWR
jgi:MacB-like periplasmic core domain